MHARRLRNLALTAAACLTPALVASPAAAQQFVPYGGVEASGLGNGIAFIGVGVGTGRPGWGLAANLFAIGIRTRTPGGPDDYRTDAAFSPSIGLRYGSATAATSFMAGYTFTEDDVVATQVGGEGPFVTAQHEYWGTGARMAQLIGTYNFDAEYFWGRAKGTQRLAPASPLSIGAEAIFQGGGTGTSDSYTTQLGPVLQVQATPQLRFDFSGGVALRTNDQPTSGYARIEFVFVPRM